MARNYRIYDEAHARAIKLMESHPFIDGHSDLPLVIRTDPQARGDVVAYRLDHDLPERDTDIPKLQRGLVGGQIWAAFPGLELGPPWAITLEQIELIAQLPEKYPGAFLAAYKSSDIAVAKSEGKIASIIAVEGGVGLDNRPSLLATWYRLGVRLFTLCHNESLDWVDSATDEAKSGGLSELGKEIVREANRLGIIVDCAHISADAMHHVLDTSSAPVVFSHSNAFSLTDHPRNVPDDVLDRIAENGGMIMATFVPYFLSQASCDWYRDGIHDEYGKTPSVLFDPNCENPSLFSDTPANMIAAMEEQKGTKWVSGDLFDLVDHIEYLAARIGVDHLGIGSDFYGGAAAPGMETVECYPFIFAELIRRGWQEDDLIKISYQNFVRVFAAVEDVASR
ncbi:dipeptidase [Rhizobium sp. 18055]|uniref:dipeptidase n=1 Tax=Rhizobium sp. 18055 TaxID=2681403 RepID=UPI001358C235|nr:dipeptidase [Rhizobium sp. 18055]